MSARAVTIAGCPQESVCDQDWEDLASTTIAEERICRRCGRLVTRVQDQHQFQVLLRQGRCVATPHDSFLGSFRRDQSSHITGRLARTSSHLPAKKGDDGAD